VGLFARLAGTMASFFQVGGPSGPGLEDNSGVLEARAPGPGALVNVRGADAVLPHDFVTLEQLVSVPGVVNVIRIPVALVTVSSVATIPAGAIALRAFLDVVTPYSAGTTITLGTAANASLFQTAVANTPTIASLYDSFQDTSVAASNPLLVTIAGGPIAGAGFACLEYVEPLV
jgi:hypothetical protein